MSVYDFTPALGGAGLDPARLGGGVDRLDVYDTEDRAGAPVASVAPAVRVGPGLYRFTIPDVPVLTGRFHATVTWRPDDTSTLAEDVRLDLPTYPDLVASPEDVAVRLRVPLPVTPVQRQVLLDAVGAAQGDVEAYLGRALVSRVEVIESAYPAMGGLLGDAGTWPVARYDDTVTVVGFEPWPDGAYTVTVRVGLDGRGTRAVHQFVVAHAGEAVRREATGMGQRTVTSLSAEGQSVSYDKGSVAEGAAGSLPNMKTLARYRRLSVFQRARASEPLWPNYRARRW